MIDSADGGELVGGGSEANCGSGDAIHSGRDSRVNGSSGIGDNGGEGWDGWLAGDDGVGWEQFPRLGSAELKQFKRVKRTGREWVESGSVKSQSCSC